MFDYFRVFGDFLVELLDFVLTEISRRANNFLVDSNILRGNSVFLLFLQVLVFQAFLPDQLTFLYRKMPRCFSIDINQRFHKLIVIFDSLQFWFSVFLF